MRLSDLSRAPVACFTRGEVLTRLNDTVAKGIAIVAAGSSCGLVAKAAEAGGADLIVVYSTGISRLMGLPTTIFGNPNQMTLVMSDEILNVIRDTPVICGVEAGDPRDVRLAGLVGRVKAAGYSGVINFPTVTLFEPETLQRRQREYTGFGFERELELVAIARDQDLFTMAYVFFPEEADAMVEAGVDCVVAHVGGTSGGIDGLGETTIDAAVKRVSEILDAAWGRRADVLGLAHGGPFDLPKNVAVLYEKTQAQGFVGASSVERIPIEEAVSSVVREFKAQSVTVRVR